MRKAFGSARLGAPKDHNGLARFVHFLSNVAGLLVGIGASRAEILQLRPFVHKMEIRIGPVPENASGDIGTRYDADDSQSGIVGDTCRAGYFEKIPKNLGMRAPLREKRHNERRQSLVNCDYWKTARRKPDIWTSA